MKVCRKIDTSNLGPGNLLNSLLDTNNEVFKIANLINNPGEPGFPIIAGNEIDFSSIEEADEFIKSANFLNSKLSEKGLKIAIIDEDNEILTLLDDLFVRE